MGLLTLSAADIEALPMTSAVEAMKRPFAAFFAGETSVGLARQDLAAAAAAVGEAQRLHLGNVV
jgi:hypothetical protein